MMNPSKPKQDVAGSFQLLPALNTFADTTSNQYSVLSWNILIKTYHYKYYPYVAEAYRNWDEHRLPILRQTIRNFNADIVCLQEADLFSFEQDFAAYFSENGGYATILNDTRSKKNNSNKKGFVMSMTTPVLYKRDKLKLIVTDFRSKATLALLQFIDDDNKNNDEEKQETSASDIDTCTTNENTTHKKRKQKKQKQSFQGLDTSKRYIWICNVHLEGDPAKPDVRFNQIKNVLNRITNKTKEYKLDIQKMHCIFTGDFNASKNEVVDELLLKGGLAWNYRQHGYPEIDIVKAKNETNYTHEWKLQSAYDHITDPFQRDEIVTFYARMVMACIDHFYYTSNTAKCIACMRTLPQWLADDKLLWCPNEKLVSDHLPIATMYEMRND